MKKKIKLTYVVAVTESIVLALVVDEGLAGAAHVLNDAALQQQLRDFHCFFASLQSAIEKYKH